MGVRGGLAGGAVPFLPFTPAPGASERAREGRDISICIYIYIHIFIYVDIYICIYMAGGAVPFLPSTPAPGTREGARERGRECV